MAGCNSGHVFAKLPSGGVGAPPGRRLRLCQCSADASSGESLSAWTLKVAAPSAAGLGQRGLGDRAMEGEGSGPSALGFLWERSRGGSGGQVPAGAPSPPPLYWAVKPTPSCSGGRAPAPAPQLSLPLPDPPRAWGLTACCSQSQLWGWCPWD